MADQYSIQDQNQFPALIAHSGTANDAETIRVVSDSSGAVMVNIGGTEPIEIVAGTVTAISAPYQTILDGTTTSNVTYVGKADSGSATSSACWQVSKVDEATSDVLTITWAGTSTAFDQVWDNRGTLGYA